MTGKNNAWFTVTRYTLYPDLDVEKTEEQEEQGNCQHPFQRLLAEKFLQPATQHAPNKTADDN